MDQPSDGKTSSTFSGNAGEVVQARDISGGVHLHQRGSVPRTPRQLPGSAAGFVNRRQELKALNTALASGGHPLTVVVGTAGVGKTSLVLRWAHDIRDRFPDGQLYVNLRGYDPGLPITPSRALESFLSALGIPRTEIPSGTDERSALYRSLLAGRRMLVVLDNAATVPQIRPLLPGTPESLVLATSRNRLSGLVARDGAHRITLGLLNEPDAIELLGKVAGGHRPKQDVTRFPELARLCARLPLALSIAAERVASHPWMTLDDLISELHSETARWTALTAEEGEETDAVHTVFSWSYRALPTAAARLFRTLALHPGPDFGSRAATALAPAEPGEVQHWLDILTGAHLLEQHARDRYQFHDLLWSFAMDQARREEAPESRRVLSQRVLLWYLRTADQAQKWINPNEPRVTLDPPDDAPEPIAFDSYAEAVGWYDLERGNLVTATRSAAAAGLLDIAWRLAIVLRAMHMRFNQFDDWITTADLGLKAARRSGNRPAEAELLESLGMAYAQSHDLPRGAEHHQAALEIRRELGDRTGEALSLNDLGLLHLRSHQLNEAKHMLEQARALFDDLQDASWTPVVTANLAEVLAELQQYTTAEDLIHSALASFRAAADAGGEGNALRLLSLSRRGRGDAAGALNAAESAVAISFQHRNQMWEGYWLLELGHAQHLAGSPDDALATYDRAALLQRRIGDRVREALAWKHAADVHHGQGRHDRATELHTRAAEVFQNLGTHWPHATTLACLAEAQYAGGRHASAQDTSTEALRLLAPFTDPTAQAVKARIRALG